MKIQYDIIKYIKNELYVITIIKLNKLTISAQDQPELECICCLFIVIIIIIIC